MGVVLFDVVSCRLVVWLPNVILLKSNAIGVGGGILLLKKRGSWVFYR